MTRSFTRRLLSYVLGLFFLAMGVTFSIKSNLGISPVNSIPYVLSIVTKINQGYLTIVVFCSYIALQVLTLRKDFRPVNYFQIVFSFLFGYFVAFSNALFTFPSPEAYVVRLILLGMSILLISLGLFFYLSAHLVPLPAEGAILALSGRFNIEMHRMKVLFDSSAVAIAALISFIAMRQIIGIREGTVISAFVIGKVLGILIIRFQKPMLRFLNAKAPEEET